LAYGKDITVQTHCHDKYTRTLGEGVLPDGMNLNQELVKQGWWWYRSYAPGDTAFAIGSVPDGMRLAGRGKESMSGRPASRIMARFRSPGGTALVFP
jgi:endonuclease YncB( thermonuclease family)